MQTKMRTLVYSASAEAILIELSTAYPEFDDSWAAVETHLACAERCSKCDTQFTEVLVVFPPNSNSPESAFILNNAVTIDRDQIFVNEISLRSWSLASDRFGNTGCCKKHVFVASTVG